MPTIDSRAIYTRDATQAPIRSDPDPDPDPIRSQGSSGTVKQMIESIVVYDRVRQHDQVERPGGEGRGEGEEKRSGSKGRGEARGGQRRARPWQSTTSTSCRRGGTSSVNVRMLKSDRGRPVSEWRHVWTIEAGAAGGHPVLLIYAGRALWWYGQARKVTYSLIDDHDDRSEKK